jgi:glucosyl-dolichyl phosphate glucuronosyltransferase
MIAQGALVQRIPMDVTVLICTRNRGESLRATLESALRPETLSSQNWELIVVDNNSSDNTARVCREFQNRYPSHFKYIFEAKTGKSNALNAGIAAAHGDVIAMTDDDAILATDYIQSVQDVFARPAVGAAQGRVLLDYEGGRPPWMDDEMDYVMARRDYGDKEFEWNKDIAGVNMVVRAEVFRKIGGFLPELGPGATGLSEDSELTWRIYKAGFSAIYAPQIVVRHTLPRERLTKSALRHRYYVLGQSLAHYTPLPAPIWRFAIHVTKERVFREVAALWYRLTNRPSTALHGQCDAFLQAGLFVGNCRLGRRKAKTKPTIPAV